MNNEYYGNLFDEMHKIDDEVDIERNKKTRISKDPASITGLYANCPYCDNDTEIFPPFITIPFVALCDECGKKFRVNEVESLF